ncbi:hypothetical protein T492DRAFT_847561 [Pavlovales sp. CCMP2436]|nr:hypothetical protein T492DRAFT_847561 [Pavlovales sp. CCMP2436]
MLACVMLLGCALPASDRTGFQAAPTVASTQARNPASDLAGFEEWKLAHGKTYGSPAEEASRYRAWTASCEELAHLEVLNFAAGVGDDAESVKVISAPGSPPKLPVGRLSRQTRCWPGAAMGLNVFADVNPSTFVADRCGLRPGTVKVQARHGSVRSVHHPPALRWASLPAKVDWRPEGLVTPPKDQGQCGSFWL